MQIHELNNFTGTLGSGSFLAVDNGTDTGKLSTQQLLAGTEARIDNIIAGPAPSAEEIVDARLGDDGVVYPSLGDAIRDQFSDVKSVLYPTWNDLYEKPPVLLKGIVINSSGEQVENPDFNTLLFYEKEPAFTITITGLPSQSRTVRVCAYIANTFKNLLHEQTYISSATIDITGADYAENWYSVSYFNTGEVSITGISNSNGIVEDTKSLLIQEDNQNDNVPIFNTVKLRTVIDSYGVEQDNSNYVLCYLKPNGNRYSIQLNVTTNSTFRAGAFDSAGNLISILYDEFTNVGTRICEFDVPSGTALIKVTFRRDSQVVSLTGVGTNAFDYSKIATDSIQAKDIQFEIGSIYTSTGRELASTTRIRSEFLRNVSSIFFDGNYKFIVACFSNTKAFIGTLTSDFIEYKNIVSKSLFPSGTVYIRLVCAKLDDSTMSQTDIDAVNDHFKLFVSDAVGELEAYITSGTNIPYLIDCYLNKGRMEYSAHRGLRNVAPENSIPAFEAAGRAGFDWLNLAQLRQSSDGTWYVMHDSTIDRTTDGTGKIEELTDAYLQTVHIDAGANIETFSPDELVIPTLEQAIQIARKYGMKLYFRIASLTNNNYNWDAKERNGWNSFISIIKKYRCEGMIFGGNALGDIRPLHRDLGLDWCVNYDVYSTQAIKDQITAYINAGIKNATIYSEDTYMTDEVITLARANGYKVMVHLSNDETTKDEALAWSNKGVDILNGVVNYNLAED